MAKELREMRGDNVRFSYMSPGIHDYRARFKCVGRNFISSYGQSINEVPIVISQASYCVFPCERSLLGFKKT
jgi:hypothetical protein